VLDFIEMQNYEISVTVFESVYNFPGSWPDSWREYAYSHPEYWPDVWREQIQSNYEAYFPKDWLQSRTLNPKAVTHGPPVLQYVYYIMESLCC
jgi:hypothetical protein